MSDNFRPVSKEGFISKEAFYHGKELERQAAYNKEVYGDGGEGFFATNPLVIAEAEAYTEAGQRMYPHEVTPENRAIVSWIDALEKKY